MSQVFSDNNHSLIVSNSFNVTATDDRSEILSWLSPLEPRIRHQEVRNNRADNIGEWLLKTGEFQSWCDGRQEDNCEMAALFCFGDPGVGKTYISSLVVDALCDRAKEQNAAVACFYVDFAVQKEQSPTNMLGSLLRQIVGGLQKIPGKIVQAFEDQKKVIGCRRLQMSELVKMLQNITSTQRTFICVDALDECLEKHRPEVLDSLRQVLEASPNTRLFMTGRRHILDEIERCLTGSVTMLPITPNNDDVTGYIRMRLGKDTLTDAMDNGLEAEIVNSITENIPKPFLLVSLTIDAILRETTIYKRRQKLGAMTDGSDVGDAYRLTLERIKEQGGERTRLGMATLMWISHSERPLNPGELLHALAVETGSTGIKSEMIPSMRTLLSCCLGLITFDEQSSTIRLIHYTLQEYIYTRPDLFGGAHSKIAETCLKYLNFPHVKDLSPTLDSPPESTPFLEYCSLHWGDHARKQTSSGVISLALEFFGQFENHLSTRLLLRAALPMVNQNYALIPANLVFTGLHCLSLFDATEITTAFMKQKSSNVNKRDSYGFTPLVWAAACGHEDMVKLLLEQHGINPNKYGLYGRTAISWAAGKGREGVVRILLERAPVNHDGLGRLWIKAPRVMNVALGRSYVNPDKPEHSGRTPLSRAAESGCEELVKLLLERKDVNPDKPDNYGRTPLSWAAGRGGVRVVTLLLKRKDIDSNISDSHGQTPLAWAIENRNRRFGAPPEHFDRVRELLQARQPANPNAV